MITDWVCEQNLKPFVEILSMYAGYDFDDGDWTAVEFGITDTDVERDAWFECELSGENTIQVALALDPGSSVLFFRAESNKETESKIDAIVPVLQSYDLVDRPSIP
jgi:hypothetical protein